MSSPFSMRLNWTNWVSQCTWIQSSMQGYKPRKLSIHGCTYTQFTLLPKSGATYPIPPILKECTPMSEKGSEEQYTGASQKGQCVSLSSCWKEGEMDQFSQGTVRIPLPSIVHFSHQIPLSYPNIDGSSICLIGHLHNRNARFQGGTTSSYLDARHHII